MRTPMLPKGKAMALHLTEEYNEGKTSLSDINPYDYWNEYTKHYAWCIGKQNQKNICDK